MNIWILVALLVVAGPVHSAETADYETSILRQIPGKTGEWSSIVNETYGYSFQVPLSTRIERHRRDTRTNEEYTRMQNFHAAELSRAGGLRPRQYWLEVFSFPMDTRVQDRGWGTCPNLVLNHTIENQGGSRVYRGTPRESSDAGGYVEALCVEKNGRAIYVQAAESDPKTLTLKRIFGSFRVLPGAEKR